MEIKFAELRATITEENIKEILLKYGAKAVRETEKYIVFPTVCHNLQGGSDKLYYYKNSKFFKCYTNCEGYFDIFSLLIKIHKLRNQEITVFQAIEICGLQPEPVETQETADVNEDINYLYNLIHSKNKTIELPQLDSKILDRFVFDKDVLKIWTDEGISLETMNKYSIKYDPIDNCIIIPNHDINGKLVGIRGRFLSEDSAAKYKPINYNKKTLSYPNSLALYGLYQNKSDIEKMKKCIVFEGEKSVLKIDSYYDKNISVATLGKNISRQQIQLLLKLGVTEIILAYDADYVTFNEMEKKRKEYIKIAKPLKTYFNVCVLIDMDNILEYKDSPIDRGKDKFEKILQNRIYI